MGLFDRIVLAVYTLSLGIFAVVFVLISIGWRTPLDVVAAALREMQGRWLIGTLSSFYLVISLRFIYLAFKRKYGGQTVMHETNLGEIRISLDAVENLVKKVARQCQGVRDVTGHVQIKNGTLSVSLRVIVSPDISIPGVSNEVQTSVKSYVRNVVGVEVTQVSVFVENITAEVRRRRVE
jgi:uncharacterized alkaline shock family protein YloU